MPSDRSMLIVALSFSDGGSVELLSSVSADWSRGTSPKPTRRGSGTWGRDINARRQWSLHSGIVGVSLMDGRVHFHESITSLWFVYLLRCADGSLYTGITTDLARRLK